MKPYTGRIILDILLLLSILFAPWWVAITLIFLGAILFSSYWEAIVAGIMLEGIFGIASVRYGAHHFIYIATGFIAYLISITLRDALSFIKNHA